MNELLKRAFFGLLYVLLVVFCLQSYTATALLFVFFLTIGLKEFSKLIHIHFNSVLLPALFVFLWAFLTHYDKKISVDVVQIAFAFTLLALFLPFVFFIFGKLSKEDLSGVYLSLIYLALPFSLALAIPLKLLLATFVIIWSSDTFAYLTGKYFGKHKLAKKISPKKTIEGFVGGLVGSLIVAYLFFTYFGIEGKNLTGFLALSVIVVVFGTLGDLLESKFKRLAQVKDSGSIMPGHGGVLDRLDSFIFAVPFVYIFLLLS